MAKYRPKEVGFWRNKYVRKMPPLGKLLFDYLFTCEACNTAGVYEITVDVMSFDTGIQEAEVVELLESGLQGRVKWDPETETVFVLGAFERVHGRPDIIEKSVLADFKQFGNSPHWPEFVQRYPQFQGLVNPSKQGLGKGCGGVGSLEDLPKKCVSVRVEEPLTKGSMTLKPDTDTENEIKGVGLKSSMWNKNFEFFRRQYRVAKGAELVEPPPEKREPLETAMAGVERPLVLRAYWAFLNYDGDAWLAKKVRSLSIFQAKFQDALEWAAQAEKAARQRVKSRRSQMLTRLHARRNQTPLCPPLQRGEVGGGNGIDKSPGADAPSPFPKGNNGQPVPVGDVVNGLKEIRKIKQGLPK